jgi:hypothetical protein
LELQQIRKCLSRVEQAPTPYIKAALSPSLKALIADKLIKHSNVDVKVALASCFNEITRIAAPEMPYNDPQMKVCLIIFYCKLIVLYCNVLYILCC